MTQKIEKILRQYADDEIWFDEAHNQLCDLHNVMLRSRNKWRLLACFFIGIKLGDLTCLFF